MARAQRPSRGGSSRIAANRHGAGCAARACQAASPVPVPRQTSQARAIRWLSVGAQPRGGGRIDLGEPGVQCGRPDLA